MPDIWFCAHISVGHTPCVGTVDGRHLRPVTCTFTVSLPSVDLGKHGRKGPLSMSPTEHRTAHPVGNPRPLYEGTDGLDCWMMPGGSVPASHLFYQRLPYPSLSTTLERHGKHSQHPVYYDQPFRHCMDNLHKSTFKSRTCYLSTPYRIPVQQFKEQLPTCVV
jgi:hypothetical protein